MLIDVAIYLELTSHTVSSSKSVASDICSTEAEFMGTFKAVKVKAEHVKSYKSQVTALIGLEEWLSAAMETLSVLTQQFKSPSSHTVSPH